MTGGQESHPRGPGAWCQCCSEEPPPGGEDRLPLEGAGADGGDSEAGGGGACWEAGVQGRPQAVPGSSVFPHVLCASPPRPRHHLRHWLLPRLRARWRAVPASGGVWLPTCQRVPGRAGTPARPPLGSGVWSLPVATLPPEGPGRGAEIRFPGAVSFWRNTGPGSPSDSSQRRSGMTHGQRVSCLGHFHGELVTTALPLPLGRSAVDRQERASAQESRNHRGRMGPPGLQRPLQAPESGRHSLPGLVGLAHIHPAWY